MAPFTVVEFKPDRVDKSVIEILEDALRKARDGILIDVAVAGVVIEDDQFGIISAHHGETQALMLIAAIDSLKYDMHYRSFRAAENDGILEID